jgi:hypothetical protein
MPCSSDQYARLYDLRRPSGGALLQEDSPLATFCPPHFTGNERSVHITCVAISQQEEVLVSYNDELVYLFQPGQSREAMMRTSAEPEVPRTPVVGKSCREDRHVEACKMTIGEKKCANDGFTKRVAGVPVARPISGGEDEDVRRAGMPAAGGLFCCAIWEAIIWFMCSV